MLTIGLRIWADNLSTETIQYVFWHVGYPLPTEIDKQQIAWLESDGHENIVFKGFSKPDLVFRNRYGYCATGRTANDVLEEYRKTL